MCVHWRMEICLGTEITEKNPIKISEGLGPGIETHSLLL